MRRVKGVRLTDKVRSEEILRELKTSKMTDMVKERKLRYCGHMWRYPSARWVKFAAQAILPGQTKTGKQTQYCKSVTKLLKTHNLTTDQMKDADGKGGAWSEKLREIFPKGDEEKKKNPQEVITLSLSNFA